MAVERIGYFRAHFFCRSFPSFFCRCCLSFQAEDFLSFSFCSFFRDLAEHGNISISHQLLQQAVDMRWGIESMEWNSKQAISWGLNFILVTSNSLRILSQCKSSSRRIAYMGRRLTSEEAWDHPVSFRPLLLIRQSSMHFSPESSAQD